MEMSRKNLREGFFYLVAAIIIFSAYYIMRKLFAGEMPANNHDAIMLAIGVILGWGTNVVNYFFGSSKGSAEKSESMAEKKP